MADENVPPGISEKQDEIIQYVAKYVVSSCDGARYQEKIRTRTKYNSYFAFLDAKHPYHRYYQYLLDSYRYYIQNTHAVGATAWGDGSGAQQQQQLTEEEYYQLYGAYQGQTGEIGFQGAEEDATGGYYGSAVQDQEETPQPSGLSAGGDADKAPSGQEAVDADNVGVDPTAAEAEADEEEEEYELVMENGEWVSRKRS